MRGLVFFWPRRPGVRNRTTRGTTAGYARAMMDGKAAGAVRRGWPSPVRAGEMPDGHDGVLMLAIAFAADDVLAPTAALRSLAAADAPAALAAAQELVRPLPGAPRVLRELEALGVGLALLGGEPAGLLRRIAQVVFFRGEVVAAEGPGRFAALAARIGLPEPCIWYVTAAAADAAEARAAGTNVILVDPHAGERGSEPDDDGLRVVAAVDDVLEVIRIPYTRSALNLRYILRKIMDAPPLDELVR